MTVRRLMFGFIAAFLLVSPALGYYARSGEGPTLEQRLRQELRQERQHSRNLQAMNRRLVRAYLRGPGYVSPHAAEWECVAEHESHKQWDSDTNPKYKGGLQFDPPFEQHYGPEFRIAFGSRKHPARANRWPKWAQLIAADRGLAVQGWGAWPNTSRMCGLR